MRIKTTDQKLIGSSPRECREDSLPTKGQTQISGARNGQLEVKCDFSKSVHAMVVDSLETSQKIETSKYFISPKVTILGAEMT